MSLFKLCYEYFVGSKVSFLKPYQGNEQEALYQQASMFWDKLDSLAVLYVFAFLLIGIAMACSYYGPFNNKPGRHYLPKYWWRFFVGCAIVCFAVTLGIAMGFVGTKFSGTFLIEFKLALLNAAYSLIVYCLTSIAWCKSNKTNAYKIF